MLALQMQQNDLKTYIAMFDNLWEAAGWERNSQGTILLFWHRLHPALAQAVINRTIPQPVTFDDWANAAQMQHMIWVKMQAIMGTQRMLCQDNFNMLRWWMVMGQWPQRDPDVMDVQWLPKPFS